MHECLVGPRGSGGTCWSVPWTWPSWGQGVGLLPVLYLRLPQPLFCKTLALMPWPLCNCVYVGLDQESHSCLLVTFCERNWNQTKLSITQQTDNSAVQSFRCAISLTFLVWAENILWNCNYFFSIATFVYFLLSNWCYKEMNGYPPRFPHL